MPAYGAKTQYAPKPDTLQHLDEDGRRHVQSVVGIFLFYGRAVDPTTLPTLNKLGTQQSAPTEQTTKDVNTLLDYMHTYPNARLWFFAGDMQLAVDSDAAYLFLPGAKSRFAGHFYLQPLPNDLNYNNSPNYAPIHTKC
eukprot:2766336-Ditylum_brightwellii.AAC.1